MDMLRGAGDRGRGSWPKACRVLPSRGTCSASTPPDHSRLRRLVSAAFTPRRVEASAAVQAVIDDLLDHRHRRTRRADRLVSAFAFPLPFTVICELLGVPEPIGPPWGEGQPRWPLPYSTPAEYARERGFRCGCRDARGTRQGQAASPGDRLVSGLITARDGNRAARTQELLSTIFPLIVAGHETTASLIGNVVVALRSIQTSWTRCGRSRQAHRRRGGAPSLRRTRSPLDVSLCGGADRHR